ncbi:HAD family hydrolase [Bdellovibrio sp. HCB288]|uniref:HAD family hydrolase n=1 Tax=Bdellovibrio sp. HCB288 TaxID=3394355 RepID=UPI0039B4FBF7
MKYVVSLIVFLWVGLVQAADPLPSWNEGNLKKEIISFVNDVTKENGSRYVRPEDRIATFDNDGTLWSEVPTIELEFTKYRIKEIIAANPALKKQEPYKSLLAKAAGADVKLTQKQILDIVARTHSGMSEEEFGKQVREFFKEARHPKLQVPYTQAVYQPMLELLAYLRENNFQIFISSGGEIAFMRQVAPEIYGVPTQNIIGSFFVDKTEEKNGRLQIMRTAQLGLLNDKGGKPVGIIRHIGKRPIISVGNERNGGDIEHLRFSSENPLPNFQIMVNHDDADREAAYSEKDNASLNASKKFGFKVLSMKNDWKQIFPGKKQIAQQQFTHK